MTKRRNDDPEKRAAVRNSSRSDACESRLRARHALNLRIQGYAFRAIGDMLSVDPSTACRDVARALRELCASNQEAAADLRAVELERLDALHNTLWPRACDGELQAIDRVVTIAARRARLYGLDAPVKTAQTTVDGSDVPNPWQSMNPAELSAHLAAMAAQLKENTHAKKS